MTEPVGGWNLRNGGGGEDVRRSGAAQRRAAALTANLPEDLGTMLNP